MANYHLSLVQLSNCLVRNCQNGIVCDGTPSGTRSRFRATSGAGSRARLQPGARLHLAVQLAGEVGIRGTVSPGD